MCSNARIDRTLSVPVAALSPVDKMRRGGLRPALSLKLSPGASDADPLPSTGGMHSGPSGGSSEAVSVGGDSFSASTKQGGLLTIDKHGGITFTGTGGSSARSSAGSVLAYAPQGAATAAGAETHGLRARAPSYDGNAAEDTTAPAPASTSSTRSLTHVSFDDLEIERTLGEGASATVYLARHKASGQRYALKTIGLYDKAVRDQLISELSALYAAECDALVGFYGATYREGSVAVLLQYFDCRGLDHLLSLAPGHAVPERPLAGIAFQALWGLGYLAHERRVHRDIKPANILVDSDGRVALTDFGISRQLAESILAKTFVGSFRYMSPERISHGPYDARSDVWSAGLSLLEAATGRFPYLPESDDDDDGPGGGGGGPASHIALVMTITETDPPIPAPSAAHSPSLIAFFRACLSRDPASRATAEELLDSDWFAEQGVDSLETARGRVREWLLQTGIACGDGAGTGRGSGGTRTCTGSESAEVD